MVRLDTCLYPHHHHHNQGNEHVHSKTSPHPTIRDGSILLLRMMVNTFNANTQEAEAGRCT